MHGFSVPKYDRAHTRPDTGGRAERLCNTAPQPWLPGRAGFM